MGSPPYFSDDRILLLHDAAIQGNLASSYDALHAGLDPSIAASLPAAGSPSSRILAALFQLNRWEGLNKGSPPIAQWLLAARQLTQPRAESRVFGEALRDLDADGSASAVARDSATGREAPVWYLGERNHYVARPRFERRILESLTATLHPSGRIPRLVTLHGFGGMGKTRLAVICAVRARDMFRDGVWFVSLEDKSASRVAVAEAIAMATGVPPDCADPVSLCRALRDREMLLILDNYESVDTEDVQGFVLSLLVETRAIRLLVTGREAVKISDTEQVIDLNEGMTRRESRELFLSRAQLRRPLGPKLSHADKENLDHVLDLTGGIPLAIEIAAAWVHKHTLSEIARGLASAPLGAMARTGRRAIRSDRAPRHSSLDRCLDWSYGLLKRETRRGLLRLGAFADSFSDDTVAAACGWRGARNLLHDLHDASLVRRIEVGSTTRYTFHRPTRAYVAEKLTASKAAQAVRRRYVSFYLLFTLTDVKASDNISTVCHTLGSFLDVRPRRSESDGDEPQVRGTLTVGHNVDDSVKRSLLDLEWRNAIAAAEHAVVLESWDSAVHITEHLGGFLLVRGAWSDVERVARLGLFAARSAEDRAAEARALDSLGHVFDATGRWHDAIDSYLASIAIDRDLGEHRGVAVSNNNLGHAYRALGRWDDAAAAYTTALDVSVEFQDSEGISSAFMGLGGIYFLQGRFDKAAQCYQRGLDLCRARADIREEAAMLWGLANVRQEQHAWEEAEDMFLRALSVCEEIGDPLREASIRNNLGVIYAGQDRWNEAFAMYDTALTIFRKLGDRSNEALTMANLASVYAHRGNLRKAEQLCVQSLMMHRELGDPLGERFALTRLGEVYETVGRRDDAVGAYEGALALAQGLGERAGEGWLLGRLAQIHATGGDLVQARAFVVRAVAVLRATTDMKTLEEVEHLAASIDKQMRNEDGSPKPM